MSKEYNPLQNPAEAVNQFSEAAKSIEGFAEKASTEILKGTLLGKFYSAITVMLLAFFAALLLGIITLVSKLSSPEYKVYAIIFTIIIFAVLFYFIWFAIINPHLNKKEKKLKKLSEQLDSDCYHIIQEYGRRPEGKDHFNDTGMNSHQKNAIDKMLRLAIIRFAHKSYKKGYEYAYHWTELGYELMNYMNIEKMTDEEFKSKPSYKDYEKMTENYKKFKKETEEYKLSP